VTEIVSSAFRRMRRQRVGRRSAAREFTGRSRIAELTAVAVIEKAIGRRRNLCTAVVPPER
jgi:hypothetical protein